MVCCSLFFSGFVNSDQTASSQHTISSSYCKISYRQIWWSQTSRKADTRSACGVGAASRGPTKGIACDKRCPSSHSNDQVLSLSLSRLPPKICTQAETERRLRERRDNLPRHLRHLTDAQLDVHPELQNYQRDAKTSAATTAAANNEDPSSASSAAGASLSSSSGDGGGRSESPPPLTAAQMAAAAQVRANTRLIFVCRFLHCMVAACAFPKFTGFVFGSCARCAQASFVRFLFLTEFARSSYL